MASKNTLLRFLHALTAIAGAAAALGIGTLVVLAPFTPARAAPALDDKPLTGKAVLAIEQYLQTQTAGLPGDVRVRLLQPASGALPDCAAPAQPAPALSAPAYEVFLPAGVKAWGRVSVGVRCHSAPGWTRYVTAHVGVHGPYYVAARAISAGQVLAASDAERREGDLATLPASVVVDPAQFEGTLALNALASGAPLRRELLKPAAVVAQGQLVKLVQRGPGFVSSAEGSALSSAAAGATVQVRMASGQVLSGVVQADGTVARGAPQRP